MDFRGLAKTGRDARQADCTFVSVNDIEFGLSATSIGHKKGRGRGPAAAFFALLVPL